MSRFRGKYARLLALLALVAGLLGAATPNLAAPAKAMTVAMAMMGFDCDRGGGHDRHEPQHHLLAGDCCTVSVSAMSLALPTALTGLVAPGVSETSNYGLRAPVQPADIVTAPMPHPPKSVA